MTDPVDLWELIEADPYPPEREAQVDEWIRELHDGSEVQPGLVSRCQGIRRMFRGALENDNDIDALMNETMAKYLIQVKQKLWRVAGGQRPILDGETLMPAVRWIAKKLRRPVRQIERECIDENLHGELIDRYYGLDQLTQEDLEEDLRREQILIERVSFAFSPAKPKPGPPLDPERLVSEKPDALIERIARSVLLDHIRKRKARKAQTVAIADLETSKTGEADKIGAIDLPDKSPGVDPESLICAQEWHVAYLAQVRHLPPVQRAAWVLCRDPDLLTNDEAETLLRPLLSRAKARHAAKQRPMTVHAAAELFGRDVSSDVTKAAHKLGDAFPVGAPRDESPDLSGHGSQVSKVSASPVSARSLTRKKRGAVAKITRK